MLINKDDLPFTLEFLIKTHSTKIPGLKSDN